MPDPILTVVIAAGQSRNPEKRALEDAVAQLSSELADVRVLRVAHLYDLPKDGETFTALKKLDGDLIVFAWLYDRAIHWTLDRNGVRGHVGEVELREETDEDEAVDESPDTEERVVHSQPRPARKIYCIDFRASNSVDDFQDEIRRIAALPRTKLNAAIDNPQLDSPASRTDSKVYLSLETLQRFNNPTNDTFVTTSENVTSPRDSVEDSSSWLFGARAVVSIDEHTGRRWYPVIDFSRCTNCMECIDFCLFGVYGVDTLETIVVEQPDNCRKGCPACSRVCPQNAIIFPQHKTPAIAGAPVDAAGLKIDLSKLFGAPENNEDAIEAAARERDEQLILSGREAVGTSTGISERLRKSTASIAAQDELDDLIDKLDSLDL